MKPATEVSGLCGLRESSGLSVPGPFCRRRLTSQHHPWAGRLMVRQGSVLRPSLCAHHQARPHSGATRTGPSWADNPCRDVQGPGPARRAWNQACPLCHHYSADFELVRSQESMLVGSTGDVRHKHGEQRSSAGAGAGASLPLLQPGLLSEARSK